MTDSDSRGHEETGEPVENCLGQPEHEDLSPRGGVRVADHWMAHCSHSATWAAEDAYDYRERQWSHDVWTYESEDVREEVYSGMIVNNGSGLAGKLLLFPGFYRNSNGQFPTRRVERNLVETIIPDSGGDFVTGYYAGKCHYETEDFEKHGTDWLRTYDQDFHGEQWWGGTGGTSSEMERNGHCVYTSTKWSDDGTRSRMTVDEDDWDGWCNYSIRQDSESGIWDFDGFGEWALGEIVEVGTIEPHGRIEAIPEIEALPKPDAWDLRPFDPDPIRIHPRDQWRSVDHAAHLCVVPILDFNSSYIHQDS